MNALQSFLDGIVAHPAEPERWPILADWLEDHDDPRAELVRLTWALQHEPDHAEFDKRQARVQALLAGGMVPVRPRFTLGPGMGFAWVAPGSFLMGSPLDEEGRSDGEEPRHPETVARGFWMGVTPVTQGQWRAVMGNNPSYHSRPASPISRQGAGSDSVAEVSDADLERFPVEEVSWEDAQAFCGRLSERVGLPIRLPTCAEWEYACRAGTRTPFHFGPGLNGTQANCDGGYPYGPLAMGPSLGRPSVVGSYAPNAWGLCDCHGNVLEFCADRNSTWIDDRFYPGPEYRDAAGNVRYTYRLLCGGCFDYNAQHCRAAFRYITEPTEPRHTFGFRVCFGTE